MADYFAGEIEIGGSIPRSDLNELIDLITNEELKEDYSDVWARDKLVTAFATQESVRLTDDQARYGEFVELEEWLIEHNIYFDRHSDARYEYDAVNTYYRGGETVTLNSTQVGTDLISYSTIDEIVNHKELNAEQKIEQLRKTLTKVPPLPKLVII